MKGEIAPIPTACDLPQDLAHRLAIILPAMTLAEALETTRIHRVAGLTSARTALLTPTRCVPPSTPSRMSG
jgi:predicted ATPase with chaperone activity